MEIRNRVSVVPLMVQITAVLAEIKRTQLFFILHDTRPSESMPIKHDRTLAIGPMKVGPCPQKMTAA